MSYVEADQVVQPWEKFTGVSSVSHVVSRSTPRTKMAACVLTSHMAPPGEAGLIT